MNDALPKLTLQPAGEGVRVVLASTGDLLGHFIRDWREEYSTVWYFRMTNSSPSLTKELLLALTRAVEECEALTWGEK